MSKTVCVYQVILVLQVPAFVSLVRQIFTRQNIIVLFAYNALRRLRMNKQVCQILQLANATLGIMDLTEVLA